MENECVDEVHVVGLLGKRNLQSNISIILVFVSCSLSNVGSEAETFNGLKMSKLNSVIEGIKLIKARLGSKKVLIILDDIDHIRQQESLTKKVGNNRCNLHETMQLFICHASKVSFDLKTSYTIHKLY